MSNNLHIEIPNEKKIYFASDNHLGAPTRETSLPREKRFVAWLNEIKEDAAAIFLLGDLFDFWMEYKRVIPKGFTRVLGKLAEISDSGIPIYYFVGNHDLWMNGYFEEELNIPVFHKPQEFTFSYGASTLLSKHMFFIGHGDGLGPEDKGYKRMKKVFTNPICKWLFQRLLHPDFAVRLAQHLSVKSKLISGNEDAKFLGEDNEWLVQYCKRKLEAKHRDFFIFGHRHLPLEIQLNNTSKYINLGDWIQYYTYGVFDGNSFELKTY